MTLGSRTGRQERWVLEDALYSLAKAWGVSPAAPELIPEECSNRFSLTWVAGVLEGGIHLMSIYLIDTVLMNNANKFICEKAAIALRMVKGPWAIGGGGLEYVPRNTLLRPVS